MASAQKKTSSSKKSGGSRASGKRKASPSKSRSNSRNAAPQKKPYRRELGAVICLLLAFFGGIGYFKTDEGAVIALFCNLLKGLFGYGFYIAPPVLLLCACILAFHRGNPVRLRTGGALTLPVLLGAMLHLFLCKTPYEWSVKLFGQLWTSGKASASGGAVSGLLAMAFRFAFSTVGAVVVLVVLIIAAILCAFRIAPVDIVDYIRDKLANRPEYDPDEYSQPPVRPEKEAESERTQTSQGKRGAIDIPMGEDEEGTAQKQAASGPVKRKKKLFDKTPRVITPDQALTVDGPAKKPRKDPEPVVSEDEFPKPEPAPVIQHREPDSPPSSDSQETIVESGPFIIKTDPIPPPVIRESTPTKRAKEDDGAQVRDEVARELEAGMEQDPAAYRYPPVSLLDESLGGNAVAAEGELHTNQQRLQDALTSFKVKAHIVNVIRGPSVTRYELELDQGVKLNQLTNLSGDIALALGASAVRVAPIPDKISTVGIEVPNRQVSPVAIRDVISSRAFTDSPSKVSFAVGKDISGRPIVGNIARLPHMLIAGTTGSGKSVCTNSLIISLLYKATPEEVRLIMVDPKMVELSVYNGIPHLLIPVVTDPKKAAGALQWAVSEMMKRYQKFSEVGAKDLASYNNHARRDGLETMPQIVVVIDELADLMLVAAKEVEESICRVAQMGRASGMHLIIATQSPRADVITGLMKANIPSRIAFAVASALESRIILDVTGAEKLVGKGDMLYAPLGADKLRVQGCFISEEEVAGVVDFIKQGASAQYDESVMHEIEKNAEEKEKSSKGVGGADPSGGEDYDELLPAAIDVVLEVGQASVSMLQRRLKLGYGRAARLVDQMEEKGVVGPFEGSKPRQLLITKEQWAEMQYRQNMAAPVPDELPLEGDAISQDAPSLDTDA